jgi:hypothetical protein
MDRESVLALMRNSRTESDWDANIKKIETLCGGLPSYWQKDVVDTDLKNKTLHPTGAEIHRHLNKWHPRRSPARR